MRTWLVYVTRSLGMAGVDEGEQPHVRRWALRLECVSLFATVVLLIGLYAAERGWIDTPLLHKVEFIVMLVLFLELVIITTMVQDKRGYLRGNWMAVLIVLVGAPILFLEMQGAIPMFFLRFLKMLLVIGILARLAMRLGRNNSSLH